MTLTDPLSNKYLQTEDAFMGIAQPTIQQNTGKSDDFEGSMTDFKQNHQHHIVIKILKKGGVWGNLK